MYFWRKKLDSLVIGNPQTLKSNLNLQGGLAYPVHLVDLFLVDDWSGGRIS